MIVTLPNEQRADVVGQPRGKTDLVSEDSSCISAISVLGRQTEEVAKMFGSHDWNVDEAKKYPAETVVMHYKCSRCDAEGYASVITSKIDHPTEG